MSFLNFLMFFLASMVVYQLFLVTINYLMVKYIEYKIKKAIKSGKTELIYQENEDTGDKKIWN